MNRALQISLLAGGLLFPCAATWAQSFTADVNSYQTIQISDNRRNPGELSPIACGDIDGDGYDDLVMGSPRAGSFTTVDSGVVYIRWGGDYLILPTEDQGSYYDFTSRPDAVTDPTESAVSFPDATGRIPSGCQINPERGGEFFGAAIATGDFNNDNFTDIAVAATHPLGTPAPGSVYIILGGPHLDGIVDLQTIVFSGLAAEVRGRQNGSRFGSSLAFGDIDLDGFDDLVIGTPQAGTGGQVDIVWGRAAFGFSHVNIDSVPAPHTRITTPIGSEMFGQGLALGDVSGDGREELFVGAPAWPIPVQSRGRVLGFNFNGGHPALLDLSVVSPYLEFRSVRDLDNAGASLVVGDYDVDNIRDLVIGAPLSMGTGSESNAGRVLIVSDPKRFAGTPGTLPTNADTIIIGAQNQERFGTSLAMTTYDQAGGTDLLVGAPGENYNSASSTGAVWIYRGGSLPKSSVPRDSTGYNITLVTGTPGNFFLGTHLATGNFDNRFENDIFFSGNGQLPFLNTCDANYTEWQNCHDTRQGRRVYGIIARSVPQPGINLGANPGWCDLP